jgi:hypothetical protein
MHYLTVNISGIDGDSPTNGALGCTNCSETTSTVVVSVDGAKSGGRVGGRQVGSDGPSKDIQVISTP